MRRHLLDQVLLLLLVEPLEDGGRVLRGQSREKLPRLVGVEVAYEVGQVLRVDLVEELTDLIRVLLEELLEIGAEEAGQSHRGRRLA